MAQEPDKQTTGGKKQVNARLSQQAVEVLQAMAFLDGKGSVQEVLGPLVEEWAEMQRNDPDVEAALRLRATRAGKRSGKVTALQGRRGKQSQS
jgi:hypothetical protein